MADLTVTAGNVLPGSGAVINKDHVFGETVTAGQSVYRKDADKKWYKAQCDGTDEESGYSTTTTILTGVALNGGTAGQPAAVQTSGSYTAGATLTVGQVYTISATAGGICPVADLVSTNRLSFFGYATTAALMTLNPLGTGVVKP